jgi:hypothetical protein
MVIVSDQQLAIVPPFDFGLFYEQLALAGMNEWTQIAVQQSQLI